MRVRRLIRLAVAAEGRRAAHAPTVDAPMKDIDADVVVVLDHAGPVAARWSTLRALGASNVAEPVTGRLPRVLGDDGWRDVTRAFVAGAAALRANGGRPIVALDDDGLLHGCVSPLAGADAATFDRAVAVVRACAPCDVLTVVEDLAPGGLDATAGVQRARALVAAAEASTLYATAGTARLPPLHRRAKGGAVDDVGHFLASAAWCVGRIDRPIVAVGTSAAPDETLVARARRLGLAGVVRA